MISNKKRGEQMKWIYLFTFVAVASILSGRAHGSTSSGPLEGMMFVTIPGGSYQMGSPSSESGRYDNEELHWVTVQSFELMTTEVTQGMWQEVMSTNPALGVTWDDRGVGDAYPVYLVSWDDCQEFISELNRMDSQFIYRLPTEAEWEYACRAGSSTRFYWGNSDSSSIIDRYEWYDGNSNSATHPVGQKHPNAWGLFDMSGNVREWCQDVFSRDYDNCPTDGSAYTGSESYRVIRGGQCGFGGLARYCRSACRSNNLQDGRNGYVGLRLARLAR